MIRKLYHKLSDRRWTIGFIRNNIEDVVAGRKMEIDWMKHSFQDRWFADPFVLDVDENNIYVLAEEYYMPIKRAYIARLTIEKQTKVLLETKPILKLNTHLSYPAIHRNGNNVYIYPESGKSGALALYRYDMSSDAVSRIKYLLNEDVGDATYTNLFGEEMLFCTKPPFYNDEFLWIYKKKNGNYVCSEQIAFSDKIGRMAGDFFKVGEKIYRPAQDCNKSYGHGIVIQQVSHENEQWVFEEKHRYYSINPDYPLGMHTLNMYKGVIVVDAVGYWHPKIASFLARIKNHIL